MNIETLEDRRLLALIGAAPVAFPTIDYNGGGNLTYSNASDLFSIQATPTIFRTSNALADTRLFSAANLDLRFFVNSTGTLVSGIPGDDLVIFGNFDSNGDLVPDVLSTTLLTAEITQFGFHDSGGPTDTFDFRFTVTGGFLAGFYAGSDLGMFTTSENSNFTTNFGVDFAGDAKGALGKIGQVTAQPDLNISITPNDTNEVGQPHSFTVTVNQNDGLTAAQGGDGVTGFTPAVGANVSVRLDGTNGAVPDLSAPNNLSAANPTVVNGTTNALGQFVVTFSSATAGLVTGNASASATVNGTPLLRDTDPSTATVAGPGGSGPASKRFVDARIQILPDDVNPVGEPHTFTVTVQQDDGLTAAQGGDGVTGFAPAPGATVTVNLDGTGGALPDVSAPSNLPAADPTDVVGIANAAGQFQVTFTSATPGDVIGNTSASLTVGGVALVRDTNPATINIGAGPGGSGPATKKFVNPGVDLNITITPNDTNEVGQPHSFTVTVNQNDGLTAAQGGDGVTGFTPAVGANVSVRLDGTNGAVPDLSAPSNLAAANPTVAGGTTNALGQFVVTFSSATAGLVIGNASASATVNGTPLLRDTDPSTATVAGPGGSGPATKRFVDARISIAPDDINPVGAPHTFTVTVQQDDGLTAAQGGDGVTGFAPAPGATVTVNLDGTGGAVPDVSAPSNLPAADPTDVVGIANAAGQFQVTFTSATPGDVIGNASASLTVGGVALVRDTNPATINIGAGPGGSGPATKKFVREQPGIDIEKTTNGPKNSNPTAPDFDNEDAPNGPGVPLLPPGSTVTWTYKVTNTGSVSFAFSEVVIVDDNGTPGTGADDLSTTGGQITFQSVQTGDADNVLEPGEVWLYKASGIVKDLGSSSSAVSFDFSGNTPLDGPDGNIRTFTSGGVSVNASAFSRVKSNGAWSPAYLGSYDGGLGVTDNSEGSGGNNKHTVDNIDRDNFVLLEFSQTVVVDAAFLGYVVGDSDLRIFIGNVPNAFNNHSTLSDALLNALGYTEFNETNSSSPRWADLNPGGIAGNVLVIMAKTPEDYPDDQFKIEKLKLQGKAACYENKAVVTVPGGLTDSDLSHYCNSTVVTPPDGGGGGGGGGGGVKAGAKFLVADDDIYGTADKTFRYDAAGVPTNTSSLGAENSKPRGIASNAAGTKNWIVDANKKVYVYDGAGVLLGSWIAGGLNRPEDIATNGTDIWIVDEGADKVLYYAGAASRTSGSQDPTSSFSLHASNTAATGIVTDGHHLWVVNYGDPDKVFKYTVGGSHVGSWTIDARNSHPTGITIDPNNVKHIWIVDLADRMVYEYTDAVGRTSGGQNAATSFNLKSTNTNPQGIADPLPAGESRAESQESRAGTGPDFDGLVTSVTRHTSDLALADWSTDRPAVSGRKTASSPRSSWLVPSHHVAPSNLMERVSAKQDSHRDGSVSTLMEAKDTAFAEFITAEDEDLAEIPALD